MFSAEGNTIITMRNLIDPDAGEGELLLSLRETPLSGCTLYGTTELEIAGCGILKLDDKTGPLSFDRTGSGQWSGELTVKVQDRHTATDILSDTRSLHFQIGGPATRSALPGITDLPVPEHAAHEISVEWAFKACLFERPENTEVFMTDAAMPVPGYADKQLAAHVNMLMSLNG